MSKNGKLIFKNYDPYITSPFGNRIHPITGKNQFHQGVDYGTNSQKLPVYAIEAGKVVKTGYSSINGNFVYVEYERLKKNALYEHLDSISVKNNQEVFEDTIIGYTGQTGNTTGIHLHFGWFNSIDQNKDWYSKNWEDFEKYEYSPPIKQIGSPTIKDETKDQYEVKISNLRVRKTPNGEILGYIKPGIYNILSFQENTDYLWLEIDSNMWVAYSIMFGTLYQKIENEEKTTSNNKIDDTNNTNEFATSNEQSIEEEEKTNKNCTFKRILCIILEIVQKILKFFKIL